MPRFNSSDLHVIKTCFEEKGWRGRRLVREFPNKGWIQSSIDRAINRFEATGNIQPSKHGARKTVCTAENQAAVEEFLISQESNPGSHLSHRKIAQRMGISRRSVQRMAHQGGIKSYRRMTVSRIGQAGKLKRFERSQHLLDAYDEVDVKFMCFHDEKDFTLEVPTNRQNNRVNARVRKNDISPQRLYHERSRFSMKLMVSCCVSWRGKTGIFFVNPQETKMNAIHFTNHLESDLLPACTQLYPYGDFILLLDGATSHTAKSTQQYLEMFAPRFISANLWPPYSPDLNVMDYFVWDTLQEQVYSGRKEPFANLQELQARIEECWPRVSHAAIKRAILQWRARLQCVVDAHGGQIAHRFP